MKKWSTYYLKGTAALFLLLLVLIPIAWVYLDENNFLSSLGVINDSSPSGWSTVFLGYYASVFAAAAGYIAVIITIHQQEQSRREDRSKEALPLISLERYKSDSEVTLIEEPDETIPLRISNENSGNLKIKNVGMREMYKVGASINSPIMDGSVIDIAPIIYKGGSAYLLWNPTVHIAKDKAILRKDDKGITPYQSVQSNANISFYYSDCYDNRYRQDFKIIFSAKLNIVPDMISGGTNDETIYDQAGIISCEVVSPPTPVDCD